MAFSLAPMGKVDSFRVVARVKVVNKLSPDMIHQIEASWQIRQVIGGHAGAHRRDAKAKLRFFTLRTSDFFPAKCWDPKCPRAHHREWLKVEHLPILSCSLHPLLHAITSPF